MPTTFHAVGGYDAYTTFKDVVYRAKTIVDRLREAPREDKLTIDSVFIYPRAEVMGSSKILA